LKSAIQFKLSRKWRCGCSESTVNKNSKWLLECPTITALVAAFYAKMFNDTDVLQSYLAGGSRIIKLLQGNQPEMSWLNIWHSTWPTVL